MPAAFGLPLNLADCAELPQGAGFGLRLGKRMAKQLSAFGPRPRIRRHDCIVLCRYFFQGLIAMRLSKTRRLLIKPLYASLVLLLVFGFVVASNRPVAAVELFTHYGREGQYLGMVPLNATKKSYPGYRLPSGARVPVSPPYFYPANGTPPWQARAQ